MAHTFSVTLLTFLYLLLKVLVGSPTGMPFFSSLSLLDTGGSCLLGMSGNFYFFRARQAG